MIPISKKVMEVLTKEYGVQFGENGISRTYSHKHHYFLCESGKNLGFLKDYYKKIGLSTSEVDKMHSLKGR